MTVFTKILPIFQVCTIFSVFAASCEIRALVKFRLLAKFSWSFVTMMIRILRAMQGLRERFRRIYETVIMWAKSRAQWYI